MTRVDGNGTGPRDPSGGRLADAGTTVRTVRGRQREQVSVCGARRHESGMSVVRRSAARSGYQWCGARRHERAVSGAALGGTIGYVTRRERWERRREESQRRVYCREVAWRGKEHPSTLPLLSVSIVRTHTAQSSHSPGLAPGPNLSTLLAAHRTTRTPRGSTEFRGMTAWAVTVPPHLTGSSGDLLGRS